MLRQQAGLPLQCRLYASDGSELTTVLHARGSSYLDDDARGSRMRRRLAWLGFRRRFFVRVAPGALLWAAALVFVVGVVGVRLDVALGIALLALGVQALALFLLASRSRLTCRVPASERPTTPGARTRRAPEAPRRRGGPRRRPQRDRRAARRRRGGLPRHRLSPRGGRPLRRRGGDQRLAWYEVGAAGRSARPLGDAGEGAPGVVCVTANAAACATRTRSAPEQTPASAGSPGWSASRACRCRRLRRPASGLPRRGRPGRRLHASATCGCSPRSATIVSLRLRESAGAGRQLPPDCAASIDIAERLQRRLLPEEPPRLEGLDIAFSYRSASAGVLSGGDFVDYYSRSPAPSRSRSATSPARASRRWPLTFVTKYILRAAVHGGQLSWPTSPGEALQELRTGLLEQPDFAADSERFVTVLFGLHQHAPRPAAARQRRSPDAVHRARDRRRAAAAAHRAGHRRRARRGPGALPHRDHRARARRRRRPVHRRHHRAARRGRTFFEDEMGDVLDRLPRHADGRRRGAPHGRRRSLLRAAAPATTSRCSASG